MDTIKNAANSASETVQQGVSGISKEGNKQVAKDSNADVGTRAEAGKDAASDKVSEATHSVRCDVGTLRRTSNANSAPDQEVNTCVHRD